MAEVAYEGSTKEKSLPSCHDADREMERRTEWLTATVLAWDSWIQGLSVHSGYRGL